MPEHLSYLAYQDLTAILRNNSEKQVHPELYTASKMTEYCEFYAACRLGDIDWLRKSDVTLTLRLILNAATHALNYNQHDLFRFLLEFAGNPEQGGSEANRNAILGPIIECLTITEELETIEWLIVSEMNTAAVALIVNEVMCTAAWIQNPVLDWVLCKYPDYVDITYQHHRALKSACVHWEQRYSIVRLFDEYRKRDEEKIAFKTITDQAIINKDVTLLKLVIENWADGLDVRKRKPNSKMDPDCREYLMSVIELQNAVGIDKWKESVRAKAALDLKRIKPRVT